MSATPGPWEISGGGIWAISPWNARVRIASVITFSPMNGLDSEANARLIASAPDMLAALASVLKWYGGPPEDLRDWSDCMIEARAALAQAGVQ